MTTESPPPMTPGRPSRPDLLEAILGATRRAVTVAERTRPAAEVERAAARQAPQGHLFRERLASDRELSIIAECKRRSPSRGVLRPDYRPVDLARGYAAAGAAAISVLTEPGFFDGGLDHLERVTAAVSVPVLRKDFIVDEYQLSEARAAGADAVLLIVAALGDPQLERLLRAASDRELAALVEVHDQMELARALHAGAEIIGVNNRNLRTLEVDLEASFSLVTRIPEGVVAVAESGIRTRDDLMALRRAGYDAFLIGETLMTQADPGRALAGLLEVGPIPRGAR